MNRKENIAEFSKEFKFHIRNRNFSPTPKKKQILKDDNETPMSFPQSKRQQKQKRSQILLTNINQQHKTAFFSTNTSHYNTRTWHQLTFATCLNLRSRRLGKTYHNTCTINPTSLLRNSNEQPGSLPGIETPRPSLSIVEYKIKMS